MISPEYEKVLYERLKQIKDELSTNPTPQPTNQIQNHEKAKQANSSVKNYADTYSIKIAELTDKMKFYEHRIKEAEQGNNDWKIFADELSKKLTPEKANRIKTFLHIYSKDPTSEQIESAYVSSTNMHFFYLAELTETPSH